MIPNATRIPAAMISLARRENAGAPMPDFSAVDSAMTAKLHITLITTAKAARIEKMMTRSCAYLSIQSGRRFQPSISSVVQRTTPTIMMRKMVSPVSVEARSARWWFIVLSPRPIMFRLTRVIHQTRFGVQTSTPAKLQGILAHTMATSRAQDDQSRGAAWLHGGIVPPAPRG